MNKAVYNKKKRAFRANEIPRGWNIALTILMTLVAIAFIMPLVLVVSVSFSTAEDLAKYGYSFIPKTFTLQTYKMMFKTGYTIGISYLMTIFYSSAGTLLSLFVMSMYAFVLAKKDYPFRNGLAFFTFFTTLFSAGLVPQYILYTKYLHINDTIWVFLLPGMVTAFNVIILRTFMQTSIPDSLFDSAKIDGANDWQVYWRIALPLSKAGLSTIGLFSVVSRWNNWFTGMLYIDNRRLKPVMTVLQGIQKDLDSIKNDPLLMGSPDGMELLKQIPTESTRMAMTIVVTLPLLVAYPFFQKYFVKGLTVGSVKG